MAASQGMEPQGNLARKLRRSWFDAPPLTSLEPASKKIDSANAASRRLSEDAVETLLLTHFTKPPKLNFGKFLVGKTKTRTLQVRNPNDYEQEVVIEKFPFKKNFTVNSTRFEVPPNDMFVLDITWTPDETGGFREMILLQVNQCFRLQAFLIGTVEAPKPPRKGKLLRKGHGFGPRVKAPGTVIQTSALTLIKSQYSPRRSQELYEEWATSNENKENSQTHLNAEDRQDKKIIQDATITKPNTDHKDYGDMSMLSDACKILHKGDMKTPTPLESTVITGLQHKNLSLLKNRKQWRNVSDITTPTLNTMSPIPRAEDNDNGVTVDSYYQLNETRHSKPQASQPESDLSALKKTFVVPAPHRDVPVTNSKAVKSSDCPDPKTSGFKDLSSASTATVSEVAKTAEQTQIVSRYSFSETLASPSVPKTVKKSHHASPGRALDSSPLHASPASPRTILNQSLSLISQMKLPKGSSPEDSDESINCSVISLGKGLVSPNSFLADMKSMRRDKSNVSGKSQNTSTPLIPSPLSVLNNSIPHSVMVSHLENIRSSLSSPLLVKKFVGCRPPTKARAVIKKGTSPSSKYKVKSSPKSSSVSSKLKAMKRKSLTMDKNIPIAVSKKEISFVGHSPVSKTNKHIKKEGVMKRQDMPKKSLHAKSKSSLSLKKSPVANISAKKSPKRYLQAAAGVKKKKQSPRLNVNASPLLNISLKMGNDICTSVETRPFDSSRFEESNYMPHKSTSFFESLLTNEDSDRPSTSATRKGRFFPDIQDGQPDQCEGAEIISQILANEETSTTGLLVREDKLTDPVKETVDVASQQTYTSVDEQTSTTNSSSVDEQTSTTNFIPRNEKLLLAAQAAQRSLSPHKFCPMSPSLLPSSPGVFDENFRRGTMTVTKNRPSDALLAAMNRRKLFNGALDHINDDGTETNEKINVRFEEHYEEIDGQFFKLVKETTDVVKSITETYVEHVAASPSEFLTPIRLQNYSTSHKFPLSGVPTHLIKDATSPSLFLTPMHRPQNLDPYDVPQSSEDNASNHQLINPSYFLTPYHLPDSPDPQHSRRSTHVVRNPKVLKLSSGDKKHLEFSGSGQIESESCDSHLISDQRMDSENIDMNSTTTAISFKKSQEVYVSAKQIHLVDYDVVSSEDGSSGNCTKDSLEASLSSDSLSKSSSVTEAADINVSPVDLKGRSAASVIQNVAVNKLLTENQTKPPRSAEDDSEDNFYDTVSENYYDALSDSVSVSEDVLDNREQTMECKGHFYNEKYLDHAVVTGATVGIGKTMDNHVTGSNIGMNIPVLDDTEHTEGFGGNLSQNASAPVVENVHCPSQQDFVKSCDSLAAGILAKENILVNCIDHLEQFIVVTKESFEVHVAEIESLMASVGHDKVNERKHLRRSVSLNALSQETEKPTQSKHTGNESVVGDSRPKLNPSKSSVFVQPNRSETQKTTAKYQTTQSTLKHRSQSMTTLNKQDDCELKSPRKEISSVAHPSNERARKPSNHVNFKLNSMKQKTAPKGVAQSRLILVKKPKTGAPRHPMPFASRNMYYDERWMEKQERGFANWLNFVLTPPDEYLAVTTKPKVDARVLSLDNRQVAPRLAPTKEVLSFRAYAARRRLNRLRRCACALYQSEPLVNIICKIEVEVESRRLASRKDKMIHADVGVKQKLLDLLLQYSSLWLRIGLETVFGEVVMLHSNQDVVGLSRFIITRLLASPDIEAEFSHPTVPHLYKEGYAAAVARHVIKKFLLLVYFLDQAKTSRLIDHDPCLFCKDADIKSSKEILIQFSREVLSGEGDLTRHLAYFGYVVNHVQKPIDEFDFAVKCLSSDLRDGLRLSRVLELLAGNKDVMKKVRTPAISRLQKIHNVEAFFKAMAERNFNVPVSPRDIVDGHREKTLLLLWHLIIHFQSSIHVNMEHLKEEIHLLKKSLQLKLAMQKIGAISAIECLARRDSGETKLLLDNEGMRLIFDWCRLVCLHYGVKVENFTVSFSDGRALCCLIHHYHPALLPLPEVKFQTTVSFQEAAEDQCPLNADPDCSADWNGGGLVPHENDPEYFDQLLTNEKSNFKIVYEKLSELGGVPLMIKSSDMSNTIPDEKVVSTCISYLCARLLDIREEVRAARVLQMAWRRKKLNRAIKLRQIKTKAVNTIIKWIRPILARRKAARQEAAAVCIQKYIKRHLALLKTDKLRTHMQASKQNALREQAAQTLQTFWRSYKAREVVTKLKEKKKLQDVKNKQESSAIIIQTYWKCRLQRKEFIRLRDAVMTVQAACRKHLAMKQYQRLKDQRLNKCAIIIQKWVRSYLSSKRYCRLKKAAITIQTNWRMLLARRKLYRLINKRQNKSAVTIQKFIRGKKQEQSYKKLKQSAQILQCAWRVKCAKNCLEKLKSEKVRRSAIMVQSVVCCLMARRRFLRQRDAAITIQKHWRRTLASREVANIRAEKHRAVLEENQRKLVQRTSAAIMLQKHWKKYVAVRELAKMKLVRDTRAVVMIQKYWRGFKTRRCFLQQRTSVTKIQIYWKMILAQRQVHILIRARKERAALIIQKYWRGFKTRRCFKLQKTSVTKIQSYWRMVLAQRQVHILIRARKERAVLIIQKYWRGFKTRRCFKLQKTSVTKIQSYWRMILAQRQVHFFIRARKERAALIIQKNWKTFVARQRFLKKKNAAILIQSVWRMFFASQSYLRKRQAAMILQNWHRFNMLARQQRSVYLQQQQAAITIQNHVRLCRQRKEFLKAHNAAIVIQAHFRCFRRRLKYQTMRLAAITIQRGYRNYVLASKTRYNYLQCQKAAVLVQRSWRKIKMEREAKMLSSAIVIQSWYRQHSARTKFLSQKSAALKIQKMFQAHRIGQWIRLDFLKKKMASIKIQSTFRMYLCQREYQKKKYAAIVLQSHYRAKQIGKACRQNYLLERKAAWTLQKFFKTALNRRRLQSERLAQHSAAVKIQAIYRCWSKQQDYLLFRAAIVCIQRRFRARLLGQAARKEFGRAKRSAVTIQRSWRNFRFRSEGKKFIAELKNHIRLAEQQKILEEIRRTELEKKRREKAASLLQRNIRLYLREIELKRLNKAAVVIQKYARKYLEQRKFQELKRKATKLQHFVRRKQLMRQERDHFLKLRNCATIIQTAVRVWLTSRQMMQERSVIKIQTNWRMHRERAAFNQASSAVRVLKSFMELKQQQMEWQLQNSAALVIQKAYRLRLQRQASEKQSAAVIVQRIFKAFLVKKRAEQYVAACLIQRTFKRLVFRKRIHTIKAVVKLQSHFKMVLARRHYLTIMKAVVVIQANVRTWLARRQLLMMKMQQAAAKCIQGAVRGWITRRKITPVLQERLVTVRHERLKHKSALKLQTLWRGYKVRKDTENVKIAKAREKVQKAAQSATHERTLGARTTSALDFLLNMKDLSQILGAVMHLEFATRLSSICCLQTVEVNAVSVLYRLISSCNRSVPHMEIIKYSICILLNLAKCEQTLEYVLESDDNIAVLLDMLQIYRDKGPIFLNTCMLLGILGLKEERKQVIVQHPQFVEKVQSIYALTKRKEKASQTREFAKAKQSAFKSCNSSLLVTPSAKRKVTKAHHPNKRLPKNIKNFDNPLTALHFMMNILEISEK